LTKGRFKENVVIETLFENQPVKNNYGDNIISVLKNGFDRWDELNPTITRLSNYILIAFKNIIDEYKENRVIIGNRISIHEPYRRKLECKRWTQLNRNDGTYPNKLKWFIISSEEGFKEELSEIYEEIYEYNSMLDYLVSISAMISTFNDTIPKINTRREKLKPKIEETLEKLEDLFKRFM